MTGRTTAQTRTEPSAYVHFTHVSGRDTRGYYATDSMPTHTHTHTHTHTTQCALSFAQDRSVPQFRPGPSRLAAGSVVRVRAPRPLRARQHDNWSKLDPFLSDWMIITFRLIDCIKLRTSSGAARVRCAARRSSSLALSGVPSWLFFGGLVFIFARFFVTR